VIVVDTNTIAYLYLPSSHTAGVERLLQSDAAWAAPILWRSEFRNLLASYLKRGAIDIENACRIQSAAETRMMGNEFQLPSRQVLALANESGCSAYDCEFVCLATEMGTSLITADRKILQRFPAVAMTVSAHLAG
jgi:predicted nucleic acid-binding protein